MLNIYFGTKHLFKDGVISYVSDYFDEMYEEEWFHNEQSLQVLRDIDKAAYKGGRCIEVDDTLIPPTELSTGGKALLLLLNIPDIIVSGDRMGDNALRLLLEFAKTQDFTITLCHWVNWLEMVPFTVRDRETDTIITEPSIAMEAFFDGTYIGSQNAEGSLLATAENIKR